MRKCGYGAEGLPWETCVSVDAFGSGEPEVDSPSSSSSESMVNSFGGSGMQNSFAVQSCTERRWYIRIHCCPILSLRDASRNRWRHTQVAVSCVTTWPPPTHTSSKRHRMPFVIQPLRKICCTFPSAYVRGPGFISIADLASEIEMIRPFHYRGDGLSLPCKRHFIANVTKVICTINTVTMHH